MRCIYFNYESLLKIQRCYLQEGCIIKSQDIAGKLFFILYLPNTYSYLGSEVTVTKLLFYYFCEHAQKVNN